MKTLLLDQANWDLVIDAEGNIAVASQPYSLAQDAASAIKTFLGECFWNTNIGVPYLEDILGQTPAPALLKATFEAEAMTVPDVASSKCFLTALTDRALSGQIQVTAEDTEDTAAANFTVVNPQGS